MENDLLKPSDLYTNKGISDSTFHKMFCVFIALEKKDKDEFCTWKIAWEKLAHAVEG